MLNNLSQRRKGRRDFKCVISLRSLRALATEAMDGRQSREDMDVRERFRAGVRPERLLEILFT